MERDAILDSGMHEDKGCINCKRIHHFDFCPACGQPYEKKELTFKVFYDDFKERVIGLDGRFIRTVLEAFRDPGNLTFSFISGNRRRFFGPVGFFFITLTFYVIIMQISGYSVNEVIKTSSQFEGSNVPMEKEQKEMIELFGNLMSEYFRVISFFSVIILAAITWLFNYKKGLNYFEHLVFAFYYYGIVYLLSPLQFFFLSPSTFYIGGLVAVIIQFGYFIWAYVHFDKRKSVLLKIIKAISIQVVVSFIVGLIAGIAVLVYLVKMKGLL